MEPPQLTTRAMLQRVVNLTKHAYGLQASPKLNVPFWHNKLFQQSSTASDIGQRYSAQSPGASTYALTPQKKFDFIRAKKFLQLELDRRCARLSKTSRYEPKLALDFVRELSYHLRRVLKPDPSSKVRYKTIVLVTIVQIPTDRQKHQSMAIVSKCLWNSETDGSVTVQCKLGYDMIAIAIAYAVYTD
ncbi:unnamed protein product [Adineta ricciae]|uniref:Uncharacterized protein n=1 Tax=Adineta ricciae TaxID=249248 RepID=A0A813QCN2_ADIRI|nr:unnamed protein product [Adineta ricciae]